MTTLDIDRERRSTVAVVDRSEPRLTQGSRSASRHEMASELLPRCYPGA